MGVERLEHWHGDPFIVQCLGDKFNTTIFIFIWNGRYVINISTLTDETKTNFDLDPKDIELYDEYAWLKPFLAYHEKEFKGDCPCSITNKKGLLGLNIVHIIADCKKCTKIRDYMLAYRQVQMDNWMKPFRKINRMLGLV
jgi:hypothetical protein